MQRLTIVQLKELVKRVGDTKKRILEACCNTPKTWAELLETTKATEPNLSVLIADLVKLRLLERNKKQHTFLTTDDGVEFLKLEPHTITEGGKKPVELRRIVQRGIRIGEMSLKERLEYDFLGLDALKLDKTLQKVYNDAVNAIKKSVTVWLPPDIHTNDTTYKAIAQLVGNLTKINPEKKNDKFSIIIEFDLKTALDLAIRDETDEMIKKRLEQNKDKILTTMYRNWHRIYK